MTSRCGFRGMLFIVMLRSLAPALAEERSSTADSAELTSETHQAVVAEMKKLLVTTKLIRHGRQKVTAELVPEPVLNWDDLPRGHHHGTLWIWGAKGRPAAIIELFTTNFSKRIVGWPGNVSHSLAAEPLTTEGPWNWDWAPNDAGFVPRVLPDAPPPAATRLLRQRQMRALAKRFTANETVAADRVELRLLTTPIWLYEEPEAGILDGGLFAFVHGGTNPETILILEARTSDNSPVWNYGCVRLGHAHLRVTLDETEVWSAPLYTDFDPKSPYYLLQP